MRYNALKRQASQKVSPKVVLFFVYRAMQHAAVLCLHVTSLKKSYCSAAPKMKLQETQNRRVSDKYKRRSDFSPWLSNIVSGFTGCGDMNEHLPLQSSQEERTLSEMSHDWLKRVHHGPITESRGGAEVQSSFRPPELQYADRLLWPTSDLSLHIDLYQNIFPLIKFTFT